MAIRKHSESQIIEASKEAYYESRKASSQGWHDGQHDLAPWRDYFLGTIVAAYRELERRVDLVTTAPGAKRTTVQDAINHFVGEFTIKDLERACPMVGRDMIRFVLKELKGEGKIEPLGKGRGAKWRRTGVGGEK